MDIKELESFRLSDAIKFHDELNPKIWRGQNLRPEVKQQLLIIAQDFLEELGISGLDVADMTVSGSNAAYSYTPNSDLDLHILVDMSKLPSNEVYRELFTAKKSLYNDSHDIKIHGIPVELYVQDAREPVVSLGEYSLKDDKWLRIPTKRRANFDQTATKTKYEKLLTLIGLALKSRKYSKVSNIIKTIKRYRQSGLDKGGEFGPENLAYKALRTQGYITKLYDLRDKLHSEVLTIENMYQDPSNIQEDDEITNYKKLDSILEKICEMVVKGQSSDKDYGMVGACILDPDNNIVLGLNSPGIDGKRVHAERVAVEKYEKKYGEVPEGSIVITTLSPCNESDDETAKDRVGESCTDYLNSKGIKKVYCGYIDPTQDNFQREFNLIETSDRDIRKVCKSFADTFLDEDYDPNGVPPGPEFKPTMPAGTVRVDVSDVYDWYKLGQHISDLGHTDKSMFGKGPPSTIMAFGSEPEEHKYINDLENIGLTTTDIDPIDKNQPKGMKRQKVDPTYNVNEAFDQPYRLKWEEGDYGDVDAYAKMDDGNYLSIMFNKGYNRDNEEAWNVEFFRNNSQEVTGEGDAQRVFATVLSAIQKFIKKYKPNRVIFSASKEVEQGQNAQSRARLYDSLVQRYARAWGFRAFRAENGHAVIYELNRIKPVKEDAETTTEHYNGIEISLEVDNDEVMVKAMMANGREMGHVLFVQEGDYLMPQDLEVEERYQGQGIAATMYDYVKSKGYKIRRSGQQTDAGAGFWDKHRPEQNVWEDDTMQYASEKTSAVNPYGGLRDNQYRGSISEASGYIPSETEKNDPRFKTALTVDVHPDSIKKNAKAFGWLTSRAGIPPTAKANGKF